VIEYIGDENALTAVAHRAGHPAVVTIDAVGQIPAKFCQRVGGFGRGGEHAISGGLVLFQALFYNRFP
jgi:hypothetical protein